MGAGGVSSALSPLPKTSPAPVGEGHETPEYLTEQSIPPSLGSQQDELGRGPDL